MQIVKLFADVPPLSAKLLKCSRVFFMRAELLLQLLQNLDFLKHKLKVYAPWWFGLWPAAGARARVFESGTRSFDHLLATTLSARTTLWLLNGHCIHFFNIVVDQRLLLNSLRKLQSWPQSDFRFLLWFSKQVLKGLAYHLDVGPEGGLLSW
jgi:hypothetical protein